MILEVHVPKGILANYIADMIFYKDAMFPHKVEKLLPDGSIHLLFDMEDTPKKLYNNNDFSHYKEFHKTYISGQHKHFIHIEVTPMASMMVVRFKPGGAFPFFPFPISSINNSVVQLEPLVGKSIETLRISIRDEQDIATKFRLMEDYLISSMRKDFRYDENFHSMLAFIQESPHLASTKDLAEKMKISQKHLISLFDKQVGLTPKALARIFRFQKAIVELENKKEIDWMQIATDCGYYDQAHFIKDFYEFSGINPSSYPSQKGDYMNYIPVQ